ncbi:MAG TPA: anthranilate synthase component I family protein [Gammaproteobacteria bacterium]|nr:anthranilate synthase component I family protein [Gammaproteobacteria bacterium]
MFYSLTKSQFLQLAQQKKYIAVHREVLADTFTPIAVFESLVPENSHAMLLESGLKFRESGSFSFIGYHPYATFATKNGTTQITFGKQIESHQHAPLELLREFQQRFHCVSDTKAKLAGHMMGFFAYDAVRYFENIPDCHADDENLPDILFHFYRINFVFDHDSNKLLIAIIAQVDSTPEAAYDQANAELENIIMQLKQSSPSVSLTTHSLDIRAEERLFTTDCDDAAYEHQVMAAKKYIRAGDAFQIVLSRSFSKPLKTPPMNIYRILRHSNPTSYMFYFTAPHFTVFGASPEKLVSVQDGKVTIAPIAGTASVTEEATEIIAQRLRDDDKECAEHMMLVDLGRNDIGGVCIPGTVKVSDLMTALRLTHVVHLVSYVRGQLAQDFDAFDVLKAAFPAGTLSGAPKIRAMEIIDELEASKRHFYGGAVCKFDALGNMDSCIMIRSGVIKEGVITVRAGAGLVYDSDPIKEAEETRHKARGVMRAVALAEGGVLS